MNYFSTLAAYVAQLDEKKKADFDSAKRDLETIAEAVEGSDITSNIFQTVLFWPSTPAIPRPWAVTLRPFLKTPSPALSPLMTIFLILMTTWTKRERMPTLTA